MRRHFSRGLSHSWKRATGFLHLLLAHVLEKDFSPSLFARRHDKDCLANLSVCISKSLTPALPSSRRNCAINFALVCMTTCRLHKLLRFLSLEIAQLFTQENRFLRCNEFIWRIPFSLFTCKKGKKVDGIFYRECFAWKKQPYRCQWNPILSFSIQCSECHET